VSITAATLATNTDIAYARPMIGRSTRLCRMRVTDWSGAANNPIAPARA